MRRLLPVGVAAGLFVLSPACGDDLRLLRAELSLQSPRAHLIAEVDIDDRPALEMFEYGNGPTVVRLFDVRDSTPARERRWFEEKLRERGWMIEHRTLESTSFIRESEGKCLGFIVNEIGPSAARVVQSQYPGADLAVTVGIGKSVGRCGTS